MLIQESNITLNFPDNNYFRFQDCDGYKKLDYVKEMDVCWYEAASDTLFIIELKNWENNTLHEEKDPAFDAQKISEMKKKISEHRINELFKKSVDSVCMFMSILLNKPYAAYIQNCSPFTISNKTTIKLVSIINWTDADTMYISSINSSYKTRFKSYSWLFNVKSFLVITKEQAMKQFSWVN